MSNHIANSMNCEPEIRSRATRTIVGVVISFPKEAQHRHGRAFADQAYARSGT
jgi:hypothetical protein